MYCQQENQSSHNVDTAWDPTRTDMESEDEEGRERGCPATTGYGWGEYPMRQVWQLQSPGARWLGSRVSSG